jgi:hypothetical protein
MRLRGGEMGCQINSPLGQERKRGAADRADPKGWKMQMLSQKQGLGSGRVRVDERRKRVSRTYVDGRR